TCYAAVALAEAGSAASPFPDPPGYHRPATPPDPQTPAAEPVSRPDRPWVQQPSPRLEARLRGWQVEVMPNDKAAPDPASGVFPSFAYGPEDATVRLANVERSVPIRLAPVAWRTRYVPQSEARTDLKDEVITKQFIDLLSGRDILQFIASERLGS